MTPEMMVRMLEEYAAYVKTLSPQDRVDLTALSCLGTGSLSILMTAARRSGKEDNVRMINAAVVLGGMNRALVSLGHEPIQL